MSWVRFGLIASACIASAWSAYSFRDAQCAATVATMERDAHQAAREAEASAREIEALRSDITARTGEIHQLREAARQQAAEVVVKEVIRYVTSDPAAGSCDLPDSWLRIKNAAARGEPAGVPEAAGGPAVTAP